MTKVELERLKNRRANAHLEHVGWFMNSEEHIDTPHLLVCIPCFLEGKRTKYPRTAKICPECARTNDKRPQKARGKV